MSGGKGPSSNQSETDEGGIESEFRIGWGWLRALCVLLCLPVFERMVLRPLVVGPEDTSVFLSSIGVLSVAVFLTRARTKKHVVLILMIVAGACMLAMSGSAAIWFLFPSTLGYVAGVGLSGIAAVGVALVMLRFFGVSALNYRDEPA